MKTPILLLPDASVASASPDPSHPHSAGPARPPSARQFPRMTALPVARSVALRATRSLARVAVVLATGLLPPLRAQLVMTHWDFNSVPPDARTSTGSLLPVLGVGTAAGLGGVTVSFGDGTGSGDPATQDDTALGLATFPAQGTGSGTRGAVFQVPTVGYGQVRVGWDQRFSSTASRHYEFQYSVDGLNFQALARYENTAGGNLWVNGQEADLRLVPGVADNPDFSFRIVSIFEPGTTAYAASAVGSSYSGSGTWRLDGLRVEGTPLPASVPEPSQGALLALGGLVGFAWCRRVRRERVASGVVSALEVQRGGVRAMDA